MSAKKKSSIRKIGIWSGASPATISELKKGFKRLNELGFDPIFDKQNLSFAAKADSKSRPYLAGSDSQKVRALLKLLASPSIEDILCVRGGYGTLRLLELLEKSKIPKKAKRLWGFSDQTSLQNYLYLRAAYPWVHSPMLTSSAFSEGNAQEIAPWVEENIANQEPLKFRLRTLKNSFVPKSLPSNALILGGNLTCLASIMTHKPQRLPKKKFYLFLEDIAEKNYRLDRVLTMLKQSGFLKNCSAILLGYFTDCPNWSGVFEKFSQENQVPVFYGVPSGHERPNVPIPMGIQVHLQKISKNFGTVEVVFPKLKIRG